MKRSLLAVAAILLLVSSVTYATPVRRPRTIVGPVLWWLGLVHRTCVRPYVYRHAEYVYAPGHPQLPPWVKGRTYWVPGWRWGWQRGQHNGWDHSGPNRGGRPGPGHPQNGEHQHGRGGRK